MNCSLIHAYVLPPPQKDNPLMGILGSTGLKVENWKLTHAVSILHYAKQMICDPLWGAEEH